MLIAKEGGETETVIQRGRFVKITAIFGFIAFILINIITLLNPSQGYELSVYDATPSIIWYSVA
jgi:hypothetical protein